MKFTKLYFFLLTLMILIGCNKNENEETKHEEAKQIANAFNNADYGEEFIPNDVLSHKLVVFDESEKNSVVIMLYSRNQENINKYLALTELNLKVSYNQIEYNNEFSSTIAENNNTDSHNQQSFDDDDSLYDYLVIEIRELNFEDSVTEYNLDVKQVKNNKSINKSSINCLDYFKDGSNIYWWDDHCLDIHYYKLNKWWHHGQICLDPSDSNPLGFWWHRKNGTLGKWKLAHKGMFNHTQMYHQHEYAGGVTNIHPFSISEAGTLYSGGDCYEIYNSGYRLMVHRFYMEDLGSKMTINQKHWSQDNWSSIYWSEAQ